MKKLFIFIICLIAVVLNYSCISKDDFTGEFKMSEAVPTFDSSPSGLKAQNMFNKYGVVFKPTFPFSEFSWNWNSILTSGEPGTTGFRYTVADVNFAAEVMDSVDKWVFQIFPASFVKERMPIKILMADTLANRFTSGSTIVSRIWEGNITDNYTIIGYTSSRFTTAKKTRFLIQSWLSLFVEKMVSSERITIPSAFLALSATGYAKLSFTNAEDVVTLYGLLNKSRKKQNTGSATAAWYQTYPAQDFGDFVAFTVYVPDAEKLTYYAKNSMIKTKVDLVKGYFLDNFGITLPYIPK